MVRELLMIVFVFFVAIPGVWGESRNSVSQWGITWYFDRDYEVGTFANGDWWVVGPVTIDSITPHAEYGDVNNGDTNAVCTGFTAGQNSCATWCAANAPAGYASVCTGGARGYGVCHCVKIENGWEVNPTAFSGLQGFDSRTTGADASRIPDLPYTAGAGESVLKGISNLQATGGVELLTTAAVLTVVAEVPPDSGRTVFRPPYAGNDKPYYSVNDIRTGLLPALAPVPNTPTLAATAARFRRVQLDHMNGFPRRHLHPVENMPDYGGDVGSRNGDGALRLMLNDPLPDKMPLLIYYLQYGIDLYHFALNGNTLDGSADGHYPGQKLPLVFASVLLDNQDMKDLVAAHDAMHEDVMTWVGTNAGVPLYGDDEGYDFAGWEQHYWEVSVSYVAGSLAGYKSFGDPYGWIDGGGAPGTAYQLCCTTQPWKGEVIAFYLLPEMLSVYNNPVLFEYIDRWVEHGMWAQPDPCAPPEATMDNYRVTFGPDPAHPGDCIRDTDPSDGTGRFPERHFTEPDAGGRKSNFQTAMWNAYRSTVDIQDLLTSLPPRDAPKIPAVSPNPFCSGRNPLLVRLRNQAGALLYISDVNGRPVRALPVRPGQNAVRWNGRDEKDAPVGPGVYYFIWGEAVKKVMVIQ